MERSRIVITGLGLTSPLGNDLATYRKNLLAGKSGVELIDMRYMGKVPAGVCHFDPYKYQKRKEVRIGTRAGSISIYCCHEAVANSQLDTTFLSSNTKPSIGAITTIPAPSPIIPLGR